MLHGAAAIHYTTASEQRLAEGPLGLSRGVVIPLGVDAELFSEAKRSSSSDRRFGPDPYVLVLGRLHPKKGLELLFDVFLELTRSDALRHWRLVVAGDGDAAYVQGLRQLIRERHGEGNVLFAGWVGGAEKLAALREAALLVLASRQENFGLVVAEALACGTPVLVSTQVNLADEIAAANAGWVVPLERAALLETLASALSDTEARQRRGAAGRALACARFTWPTVATELAHLYSAISRTP
jgi:glycosyltransferase involved in cell wall biosynthesis